MIFLKKKDIIDVIATGRFLKNRPLQDYLKYVNELGFQPRIHSHMLGEDPFYANTNEKRAQALQAALMASDAKAIWCLKGGYGTTRALAALPPMLSPPFPKLLIGSSDCTALLFYAYKHWGWHVVHGPMLGQMVLGQVDRKSQEAVKNLLLGRSEGRSYGKVLPLNEAAETLSFLTGPAMGGNLSLLQSSVGTPWMPPLENTILFIEDIDESAFRILERVHQLAVIGALKNVNALILFDFTPSPNDRHRSLFPQAFHRLGQELSLPVFKGQGVGHTKRNLPVVLGKPFIIEKGQLFQAS